jgi:hypothetical protein
MTVAAREPFRTPVPEIGTSTLKPLYRLAFPMAVTFDAGIVEHWRPFGRLAGMDGAGLLT